MADKETKNTNPENSGSNAGSQNPPASNSGANTPPVDTGKNDFKINDAIQIKIGVQVYKGTILKTDAKGEMPFVILLTDHNDKSGKHFSRMAKAEQLEKIK